MILILAETGFRIGEVLGIDYTKDIDYQNRKVRVGFREDNENGARAKNFEFRESIVIMICLNFSCIIWLKIENYFNTKNIFLNI